MTFAPLAHFLVMGIAQLGYGPPIKKLGAVGAATKMWISRVSIPVPHGCEPCALPFELQTRLKGHARFAGIHIRAH